MEFLALIFGGIITYFLYNYSNFNKTDFLLAKHLLDETCDLFKEQILSQRVSVLRSKYNLNEESQLNAKQAYNKAENELFKQICLDVYKSLNKKHRNILLKYLTKDNIFMIIIHNLRS